MNKSKLKEENKVSIIVATYNSGATVKDTLDSIIAQSYTNVEIIVQDGGSTDDTISIAESYKDERIKIFQEKDSGIYDAMNKGVAKASGEIVGILNSDDVYASDDVVHNIIDTFQKNDVEVVYGDLKYVDENLEKELRYWKSKDFKKSLFYIAWQPPHPTVYLRREVYDKVGNFNTKYRIAADFDLMFRVFYNHKLSSAYLNKTLVKMRIGGESNRSWKNRWILIKEYQSIYAEHGHRLIGPLTIVNRLLSRIVQYKLT